MKDTEKKSWVYYVAIFLVKIWYAIMFKVEIIGKENIPETGNGVICSNHYSNYDPVFHGDLSGQAAALYRKEGII